MRILLLGLVSLATRITVSAQEVAPRLPVDTTTHLITYSKAIKCTGVSKALLYARAERLFAQNFSSLNHETYSFNREAATVHGTGRHYYDLTIAPSVTTCAIKLWFTAEVVVEEGQYTYTLNHFRLENASCQAMTYLQEGPVEAFVLREPTNRLLQKMTQQERRFIQIEADDFLNYFMYYMAYSGFDN